MAEFVLDILPVVERNIRPHGALVSRLGVLISAHRADHSAVRRASILLALAALVLLAIIPFAKIRLPAQPIFIPVVQTLLIVNDWVTALLLFAQVYVTRSRPVAVVACGYTFAALMAMVHMLSFPGVFGPSGLLGGNQQTTAYLYALWHAGFAAALLLYAVLRRRRNLARARSPVHILRAVAIVVVTSALLTAYATLGSSSLPPMLNGNTYSSAFNVARYGVWFLTALAVAAMWRVRERTILDLWLLVVLANYFIEIALVAIFNTGRYDVGFYFGRIFALLASCCVLGAMLFEQARLYAELLAGQEAARSELRLREGREVLRRALLAGGMGAWSADLNSHRVWWSVELEAAAGLDPGSFPGTRQACLRYVHPDDLPQLRRAYRKAVVQRQDFGLECRFLDASGEWRWISGRGRPELGSDGRAHKLVGSVMDVTDGKRAEIGRRELETSLRQVADELPVLAWMAQPNGAVTWYNRRWHEYTGISLNRHPANAWQAAADSAALPQILREVEESLRTGEPFEKVVQWRGADGKFRPFLSRCVAIRGGDQAIMYWLGTSTDISEQHSTELALRKADRHKDAFLATLVHELRTPLAPIRHALELLARLPDVTADASRLHLIIDRQSLHLARLVEDLLDAALVAQGKLAMRKQPTSLSAALSDAADAVRPLCEAFGQEISLLLGGEDIELVADPRRLRQIFSNLLNNAARFMPRSGLMSIQATCERPDVYVTIDHTCAMEPVQLEGLFALFSQLPSGAERPVDGSGIGLALARTLVAAHGGTISVTVGAGGGTTITVALPLGSVTESTEVQLPVAKMATG